MVPKYSKDQSYSLSLSNESFRLSYLLGFVTGAVAFDIVEIGPFQIPSQAFGGEPVSIFSAITHFHSIALVDSTLGLGLSGTGSSGVLGLSFPSVATISGGETLLDSILSNFDERNRFFAFKLGRSSGANDAASSFTFGQLDPDITSDLTQFSFMPVSKAGVDTFDFWKLPLQSLRLDSAELMLSPSLMPNVETPIAVLDTGSTLILGPTLDVDALWQAVGQEGATRKNDETGLWEVQCNKGILISFVLGDPENQHEYPMDPSDINWAEGSNDAWCMGGIQANDRVCHSDYI